MQTRYGNTIFDYSLNYVWDLKAHTAAQHWPLTSRTLPGGGGMILNDEQATRECVAAQGLGFLVVSGEATMDEDGTFLEWHRAFKAAQGLQAAASNSGKSRVRKTGFAPLTVEAFWIANTAALAAAVAAGQLKVGSQGRQAPNQAGETGAARRPKFQMDVTRAREGLLVSSRRWVYPAPRGTA